MAKSRNPATRARPSNSRSLAVLALALAAVGVILAAFLVWIHLSLKSAPGAGSVCDFGGYFDCDTVNASRFAAVFGVPVAYGALAMYALLGAVALTELKAGSMSSRVVLYARVLGTIAVAYSAYLALLSLAVLHAVCLLCVGLYFVNAGFAVLGWLNPVPTRGVLTADLRRLFTDLRAWPSQVGLAALFLGAIATRELALRAESRAALPTLTVPAKNLLMSVAPGHGEGPPESPVIVVGFSDFECPHCKTASAALDQLRSQFAGKVRFVFKHFPLDRRCNRSMRGGRHLQACAAADAAVCAGKQDRFWQFQREVFDRGATDEALQGAARAVGLDLAAWQQCRWRTDTRDKVKADVEDGIRVGVHTTPTFLVGNEMIAGRYLHERLSNEIRRQLSKGREPAESRDSD